jgi:CheY-like chemotaxis protein
MGRVLIADDEEHILEVMIDVLEGAGHVVIGVHDGEQAVKRLRESRFDVALIDVMMPKMDGYHVAAQIHGLEDPPRVVIVTSRNFDGDKQALYAAGVAAFLPKPFSNRDLIEVVARLLAEQGLH